MRTTAYRLVLVVIAFGSLSTPAQSVRNFELVNALVPGTPTPFIGPVVLFQTTRDGGRWWSLLAISLSQALPIVLGLAVVNGVWIERRATSSAK